MRLPDHQRTPTLVSFGTASLSISSLFVFSSGAKLDTPVRLPPGCARLATKPRPTGSPLLITMGMVVVAFFAADADGGAEATIKSTLRRTSSAASSGRRSGFCSANRYSMVIFFPSIHPSLLSSCRKVSMRTALPEALLESRKPMRGTFPGCCALATAPVTTSTKAIIESPNHFRFWIFDFRLPDKESRNRIQDRSIMFFSLNRKSAIANLKLPYHLIRSCQHIGRNRQADLLGGLQIDDELELRRLLHGKFCWLCSFENSIHIICGTLPLCHIVSCIGYKTTILHILPLLAH